MKKVGRPAVVLAVLVALAITLGPQRGEARTDPSKYMIPNEGPQQIGDPDGSGGGRADLISALRRVFLVLGASRPVLITVGGIHASLAPNGSR